MKIIKVEISDRFQDPNPQTRAFQILDGYVENFGYVGRQNTTEEFNKAFTKFILQNLQLLDEKTHLQDK